MCLVRKISKDEYLCRLKKEDLNRFLETNESRDFKGCLSIKDCQNGSKEKCPITWAGQFKNKESKPTTILEFVAEGKYGYWVPALGIPHP